MIEYLVVAVVALLASGLTMFSGFGLGTILLPVFALFVPVDLAIAATAVVHAANNVLKASLLGRLADWRVVVRFGVPAILAALAGAWLLSVVAQMPEWGRYDLYGFEAVLTPLNLVIAGLMVGFAVLELAPRFDDLAFDERYLPIGGVLSGFFGGLSGHQGALRSAFLAKTDITAQAFVGTNAVIGLAVDLVRIVVYGLVVFGSRLSAVVAGSDGGLILVGSLAAFGGVLLGRAYLHKVTMTVIRRLTGVLLLVIALLLGSGLI